MACAQHVLVVTDTAPFNQLLVFGANANGQLGLNFTNTTVLTPTVNPTFTNTNISLVAASFSLSMVLLSNGSLYSFGWNLKGECGLGFISTRVIIPTFVLTNISIIKIDSFQSSSGYLTSDGYLYNWGDNNNGQLGLGLNSNYTRPTLVPLSNITDISFGIQYSILTLFNGTDHQTYTTGNPNSGRSCTSRVTTTYSYSYIPGADNMIQVETGDTASLLLSSNQEVFVCGLNQGSVLGLGPNFPITILQPTKLENIIGISKISMSHLASILLHRSGNLVYSLSGNLGNDYRKPLPIFSLGRRINRVISGPQHGFFMSNDGKVYGYGKNTDGQLGKGDLKSLYDPEEIKLNFTCVDISAGNQHTVFLSNESLAYTCGSNSNGQLGNNSTLPSVPTIVLIRNITLIAAGEGYTLFVTNSSDIYYTGSFMSLVSYSPLLFLNVTQLLKVNRTSNTIVQITNAFDFIYILLSNGMVFTNGLSNQYNQLGYLGPGVNSQATLLNITISNRTVINTFNQLTVGLSKDNTFVRTSNDIINLGFLGSTGRINSLNLTNVKKIASGQYHGHFVTFDRKLYSIGKNDIGQLGIGDQIDQTNPVLVNLQNVVDVSGGDASFVINECNETFTGLYCDEPVCFGNASSNQLACSGQGKCVAPDTCECYSPSYGKQCEFADAYYWREKDGEWGSKGAWYLNRQSNFITTQNIPGEKFEDVFFDPQGTNTLTITISRDLKLTNIYTRPGVTLNLKFTNSIIQVRGELNGNIESTGSSFIINNLKSPTNSIFRNSIVTVTQMATLSASTWQNTNLKSPLLISNGLFNQDSGTISDTQIIINDNMNVLNRLSTLNVSLSIQKSIEFSPLSITNFTQSTVFNYRAWKQYGSIVGSNSILLNLGSMILDSRNGNLSMFIDIQNNNRLDVIGNNTIFLRSTFDQTQSGLLCLNNSKISVLNDSFSIKNGISVLSGTIETSKFVYSSSDGIFKLNEPYLLRIKGDAEFSDSATIFLNAYGMKLQENERIIVEGKITLNSFIYVKVNYQANLDDRIPFITFRSLKLPQSSNIYLSGLIYKGGEFDASSDTLYLKVVLSYGSVANKGYLCHYLGRKKILERNIYESQKKVMISITVPKRENLRIGFGFDINGNDVQNSLLSIASFSSNSVSLYRHSKNSTSSAIDLQAFESQSLFQIGPKYYTLTIFIQQELVTNQSKIFYAELPELYINNTKDIQTPFSTILSIYDLLQTNINNTITSSHYYEIFDWSILNTKTEDECTNFLQPSRAETLQPAILSLMLIFYFFLLVLCLIFVFRKPLNTRGIAPFITLLVLFSRLILEIRNYFEIPEFQGSLCIFISYGIFPFQVIIFVVSFFYFLKYFAIINLNENKKNIYKTIQFGKAASNVQVKINRILKILSNPFLTYVLIIITYFLLIFINTIVLASTAYKCKFGTLIALKVILNLELITIYALTILSFIGDMIPNYQLLLKCGWIQYIFFNDPYYFRAQVLLYFPFMLISLLFGLIDLGLTSDFLGIVKYNNVTLTFNTIIFSLILIIDVLFILVITIFETIRNLDCKKKKTSDGILEELLKNEATSKLFIEFCEKEFSLENVVCYQDIQKFRQNVLNDPMEIYTKYLNGASSVMEINCQKRFCDEILGKIEKKEFDKNLFSEIEKELRTNLYDNYGRFKNSTKYVKYLESVEKEKEMIEGPKGPRVRRMAVIKTN